MLYLKECKTKKITLKFSKFRIKTTLLIHEKKLVKFFLSFNQKFFINKFEI